MNMTEERRLPEGWKWVTLGKACEVIAGQSPPGETYRKSPEGLPFFQGKTDFGLRHPIARTWCVSPVKIAISNDILISVRAPVGPTNVADVKCCIGRGLAAIRCGSLSDFDYILWTLKFYESHLARLGSGSTFSAINRSDLENLNIPLPPLPEQKRIAAILNEYMAAVEKARAAAEARLEAAKALRSAYLREVFESEEAKKWQRKKLGKVALLIQNGIYKSAENYGHGHPFVRMYNIPNASWNLNLTPLAQVFLEESELDKFRLKSGDILISRVNSFELVGKSAFVGPEAEGYVFENMLIRIRFNDSVDPMFVSQQMSTNFIRAQIEKVAKRAIGQSSINSDDIRKIEVAFPPVVEQTRIAIMLNEKAKHIDLLSKELTDEFETIKSLPSAILRRAFNGEL